MIIIARVPIAPPRRAYDPPPTRHLHPLRRSALNPPGRDLPLRRDARGPLHLPHLLHPRRGRAGVEGRLRHQRAARRDLLWVLGRHRGGVARRRADPAGLGPRVAEVACYHCRGDSGGVYYRAACWGRRDAWGEERCAWAGRWGEGGGDAVEGGVRERRWYGVGTTWRDIWTDGSFQCARRRLDSEAIDHRGTLGTESWQVAGSIQGIQSYNTR